MRKLVSLLFAIAFGLCQAGAQVQWIADAPLPGAQCASLYKMLEDGKPIVIAIGNMHSQASERLLNSELLQKLALEHGSVYGDRFSTKDLHVAFVDVQIMPDESVTKKGGLQFIHLAEDNEVLNKAGWNDMYSIYGTRLYIVTPDHLVRPLKSKTADEAYAEARLYTSRIRPTAAQDIRLLDAVAEGNSKTADIRVQNFSTNTAHGVEVIVLKNGREVARGAYDKPIAPLEDAMIAVSIPEGIRTELTIIAKADGDTNETNNRWMGTLRSTVDAPMIAGTYPKR
jgi:hypothetical protein